jgi:hypothetical protein
LTQRVSLITKSETGSGDVRFSVYSTEDQPAPEARPVVTALVLEPAA